MLCVVRDPIIQAPQLPEIVTKRRIRGTVAAMTLACAVGPCKEARMDGSSYCSKHGPKADRARPGAAQILCPHCQVRGRVVTKRVKVKHGISGGKATGALLTGGKSLWMTGLSRKETATQATCGNCHVTWMI